MLVLGAWNRRQWAQALGFVAFLFPLPVLLGFLMGLTLDFSFPQEKLDGVWAVNTSKATLFDQAASYKAALDQVRSGAPEEGFWSYLEEGKLTRNAWRATKPWTRMYDAKPVGISKGQWCLATLGRYPDRAMDYCASQPDSDQWLVGPSHE